MVIVIQTMYEYVDIETVKILQEGHVDTDVKDANGCTALDVSSSNIS